jgi:DNA-binding IclR family transcriptional regulator
MSSLESAVSILCCFSPEMPELAVTQVAAQLNLPKSTVSRLLMTMAERHLVEQDVVTRRYRVGLLPLRLGQLYYAHMQVVDLVNAELETLVNETGFTGYAGVLNGADIVILRKKHGRYPVRMVLDTGTRMSAATTAFGKALLARLPDDRLGAMLPSDLVEGKGAARKPVTRLASELALVRKQRWAIGDTAFPGMAAIGTAVGSSDDQQAIGFSLSFPDSAVDPAARKSIAKSVVAAARRVAAATADPVWVGSQVLPPARAKSTARQTRAVAQ